MEMNRGFEILSDYPTYQIILYSIIRCRLHTITSRKHLRNSRKPKPPQFELGCGILGDFLAHFHHLFLIFFYHLNANLNIKCFMSIIYLSLYKTNKLYMQIVYAHVLKKRNFWHICPQEFDLIRPRPSKGIYTPKAFI